MPDQDLDELEARLAHPGRFYPPTFAAVRDVITELRAAREREAEDAWQQERADARDVLQRVREEDAI
jgi:hypothetical protein